MLGASCCWAPRERLDRGEVPQDESKATELGSQAQIECQRNYDATRDVPERRRRADGGCELRGRILDLCAS